MAKRTITKKDNPRKILKNESSPDHTAIIVIKTNQVTRTKIVTKLTVAKHQIHRKNINEHSSKRKKSSIIKVEKLKFLKENIIAEY